MFKNNQTQQLSSAFVLVCILITIWIPVTHESLATWEKDTAYNIPSPGYEDFWSSLDPILTPISSDISQSVSLASDIPFRDTELGVDIGNHHTFSIFDDLDFGEHIQQNLESPSIEILQQKIDTSRHSQNMDSPIITIPDSSLHIPDNELASTATSVVHGMQIMIMSNLKKQLKPSELEAAKKIWNDKILLPFVYVVVSHDPGSEVSRKAMKLAAIAFVAYHKKFLAHYEETNYDNLARFLGWTTDIFHQITDPKLHVDSSTEKMEESLTDLGQTKNLHPVSQVLLILHGQHFNSKSFSAKNRAFVNFSKNYIIAWEKDMQKQKCQNNIKPVCDLWKEWNNKAEQIMLSNWEQIGGVHFKPDGSVGTLKHTSKPADIQEIQPDTEEKTTVSVYKMGLGFAYLMNTFLKEHSTIWGVSKDDSTCKILHAYLNHQGSNKYKTQEFWFRLSKYRQSRQVSSESMRRHRHKGTKRPVLAG